MNNFTLIQNGNRSDLIRQMKGEEEEEEKKEEKKQKKQWR
jgi:hypothetical protein